jgi:hypothetical protein
MYCHCHFGSGVGAVSGIGAFIVGQHSGVYHSYIPLGNILRTEYT